MPVSNQAAYLHEARGELNERYVHTIITFARHAERAGCMTRVSLEHDEVPSIRSPIIPRILLL